MKHLHNVLKIIVCIVAGYVVVNLLYDSISPNHYLNPKFVAERRSCDDYRKVVQDNIKTMDLLHDSLTKHDIKHFLMYGSIWGPLRNYNGPLPWDHDIDIGVLVEDYSDDRMEKVADEMKLHGIELTNNMFYFGAWRITHGHVHIDIMVFQRILFSYRIRQGLQVFLLPAHYIKGDLFPSKYVDRDMKKVRFGHRMIHMPNEDIVKSLYPDDWQKVKKPLHFNCSNTDEFYK